MPAIRINADTCIKAEVGATVLEAATAAGQCIPYSCRSGRCSTCKCRLLHGETTARAQELGLSAKEVAEGWILSCVRTAVSDVDIAVELLQGVTLPTPRVWPCRVDNLTYVAPDVLRLRLRLPPTSTFMFIPGQYVELIGPNGLRRSYSLAAGNAPGQSLELHVRRLPGGSMSALLFQHTKVNDLLRLHGPLGTFFLRDIGGRDLVFLATGTGIASVKAMLESLPELDVASRPRSVAVYWGGRTREDLYLDIASMPGDHRFVPVLSRADAGWQGARGHVQNVFLACQPELAQATVYACGSDAMIHSARTALVHAGLSEHHFHSDAFVCSSPTLTSKP